MRPVPDNFACGWSAPSPIRQGDVVVDEVAHHAMHTAAALEHIEHQPDDLAHALVGVQADLA
jgi:hypothetical protein